MWNASACTAAAPINSVNRWSRLSGPHGKRLPYQFTLKVSTERKSGNLIFTLRCFDQVLEFIKPPANPGVLPSAF